MKSSWSGVLAALAVAVTLTACSTPQQTNSANQNTTTAQHQSTSADHDARQSADATSPSSQKRPYDAEFLDMMGFHHEDAVKMSREALEKAKVSQVRELAQNIITDQEAEIDHMKSLRKQWYPNVPAMTMDEAMKEMKHFDLSEGSGSFDKRFLSAMIDHHKQALEMAGEARTKAEHAELKKMAEAMYAKQEKEIAQMERMEQMARR